MPTPIQLPDGRTMIHAPYADVCQEMNAVFNIPPHQALDTGAPRRNICNRALKAHETRLTQEHEAVMPGTTPLNAPAPADETPHEPG